MPEVFAPLWVPKDLVISQPTPTHGRAFDPFTLGDGDPFPGGSAVGSTEAPGHFKYSRSIDD
jgi:hypothetical protein